VAWEDAQFGHTLGVSIDVLGVDGSQQSTHGAVCAPENDGSPPECVGEFEASVEGGSELEF
jgi:hypothetical protein